MTFVYIKIIMEYSKHKMDSREKQTSIWSKLNASTVIISTLVLLTLLISAVVFSIQIKAIPLLQNLDKSSTQCDILDFIDRSNAGYYIRYCSDGSGLGVSEGIISIWRHVIVNNPNSDHSKTGVVITLKELSKIIWQLRNRNIISW
jgi:hypothetical protein